MPVAVTVVKMIGRGVVKVHRQLDQTQTEDAGIEIDVRLRMACDCRHMMNARNVVLHTTYPCAITLMPARLKKPAYQPESLPQMADNPAAPPHCHSHPSASAHCPDDQSLRRPLQLRTPRRTSGHSYTEPSTRSGVRPFFGGIWIAQLKTHHLITKTKQMIIRQRQESSNRTSRFPG